MLQSEFQIFNTHNSTHPHYIHVSYDESFAFSQTMNSKFTYLHLQSIAVEINQLGNLNANPLRNAVNQCTEHFVVVSYPGRKKF